MTASQDQTVRIWDTDPDLLARIAEIDAANTNTDDHTSYVGGTRLLADGRAVSWAKDATLRIWGGEEVLVLAGHTEGIEDGPETVVDRSGRHGGPIRPMSGQWKTISSDRWRSTVTGRRSTSAPPSRR